MVHSVRIVEILLEDKKRNMKLTDLAECEKKEAILDTKGRVLCPSCEKRLAKVTEYGMIRNCNKCGEVKNDYNVMVMVDEPNGRRSY